MKHHDIKPQKLRNLKFQIKLLMDKFIESETNEKEQIYLKKLGYVGILDKIRSRKIHWNQ
jgi:hypothetical protein